MDDLRHLDGSPAVSAPAATEEIKTAPEGGGTIRGGSAAHPGEINTDRVELRLRVPAHLRDQLQADADGVGIPLASMAAVVLAGHYGALTATEAQARWAGIDPTWFAGLAQAQRSDVLSLVAAVSSGQLLADPETYTGRAARLAGQPVAYTRQARPGDIAAEPEPGTEVPFTLYPGGPRVGTAMLHADGTAEVVITDPITGQNLAGAVVNATSITLDVTDLEYRMSRAAAGPLWSTARTDKYRTGLIVRAESHREGEHWWVELRISPERLVDVSYSRHGDARITTATDITPAAAAEILGDPTLAWAMFPPADSSGIDPNEKTGPADSGELELAVGDDPTVGIDPIADVSRETDDHTFDPDDTPMPGLPHCTVCGGTAGEKPGCVYPGYEIDVGPKVSIENGKVSVRHFDEPVDTTKDPDDGHRHRYDQPLNDGAEYRKGELFAYHRCQHCVMTTAEPKKVRS